VSNSNIPFFSANMSAVGILSFYDEFMIWLLNILTTKTQKKSKYNPDNKGHLFVTVFGFAPAQKTSL